MDKAICLIMISPTIRVHLERVRDKAMVYTLTQMGIYIREIGWITKDMVRVDTHSKTEAILASGSMISNMEMDNYFIKTK